MRNFACSIFPLRSVFVMSIILHSSQICLYTVSIACICIFDVLSLKNMGRLNTIFSRKGLLKRQFHNFVQISVLELFDDIHSCTICQNIPWARSPTSSKKIGDSGYINLKLISFCIACVTGIVFHDLYARFHEEMKGGFEERISL